MSVTVEIEQHLGEQAGQPLFHLAAGASGTPVLYVHGVPDCADMWVPFLERTGGIAPDLPGFGRSGKRGDLDYSIGGYDRFLEAFLDRLEIGRVRLVCHDWGAAALAWAQRFPDRVERLVIMNGVPLLPGYRWHRTARIWRTRGLGELSMGASIRPVMRLSSREGNVTKGPLPDATIDSWAEHLDEGTQRAILELYRSADPDVLAAAGERLGAIDCPALVLWGERDPYIPARFADAYAAALGGGDGVEVERLPDAGHWPWLDRPDVIDRVAAFL